jgi:hypothetical protein
LPARFLHIGTLDTLLDGYSSHIEKTTLQIPSLPFILKFCKASRNLRRNIPNLDNLPDPKQHD